MRLQFGSLIHAPGGTINPRRPVAADATAVILLPLSGAQRTWSNLPPVRAVVNDPKQTWRDYASALLFVQLRIGFIRRRLGFGALGFAQPSFLVSLSLFLLAPSTCRPRSLGSISPVIWLKRHRVPRWLITHLSALYKRVAMPSQGHLCASNS